MRIQSKRVVLAVFISTVMAAIRTIIIQYSMEKHDLTRYTYYLPDNIEVTVFTVAAVTLTLLFAFGAYRYGSGNTIKLKRSFGAMPTASLVLSFALIGAALFNIAMLVINGVRSFSLLDYAILAATLLSAAKFFVSGLHYNAKLKNSFHALAALAPIIFSILRLLNDFIRTSAAPLASSGAYHIVGLIAVLVYFLNEGKSYVNKTSAAIYYASGYIALFYLLIYSLPNLILHCFGSFCFDSHAAFSVVDLGLVVYISARLASAQLIKIKKEEANEPTPCTSGQ